MRPTNTQPQQTDQSQPTNTGQQNGLTPRVPQPQGTLQGQQTARTDPNKQRYASTVPGRPVGLPVGPRREIRQRRTNNHRQQHQRQQNPPRDQRQPNNNNNNNQSRTTQIKDTYDIIGEDGLIERMTEWKTIPFKSDSTKKREHKRHLEDLAQVEKEVVLHGVPTLINGAPAGKKSDEARVKKILRELRTGGYEVKNGDVEGNIFFTMFNKLRPFVFLHHKNNNG